MEASGQFHALAALPPGNGPEPQYPLVTRILDYINLIWITDIVEQQYIMTVRMVTKFQIGLKLDMECHKVLFWDLYSFFYI